MSGPYPIRVVGCGSPVGDDALAWEVVRQLRAAVGTRPGLELHSVEGGQRLLDLLDGQGALLLVDGLAPQGKPGTIQRFVWPDRRVEVLRPGTTHHLRPPEALHLAATLGLLPARVVIFGIEVESLAPQGGLSAAVAAAVPELVRRIVQELGKAHQESGGMHA